MPLGSSDKLKVGEWVAAIGSPFGLEHTVTAGIVSAKGRVIGSGPYDDFIQTDAAMAATTDQQQEKEGEYGFQVTELTPQVVQR